MKVLVFTTLYPNENRHRHGIFVETRLQKLLEHSNFDARVVAPVPWYPFKNRFFAQWSKFSGIQRQEIRNGLTVHHPRFLTIPKFGMSVAPVLIALGTYGTLRRLRKQGFDFDVIDSHYYYPDGVAAVLLGKLFKKPVLITGRGTDLNVIADYRIPRSWIRWASQKAFHSITVSAALKNKLLEIGAPSDRVSVIRNGVDSKLFSPPADRTSLRKNLNIEGKTILSVGNLIPLKGHDLVIRAIEQLSDVSLIIIGEGEQKSKLERIVIELNMMNRVTFVDSCLQKKLRNYYAAADAVVLASSREGMPNVVLEALSCGTPVVATTVGGIPEVLRGESAGILVERSIEGLRSGIEALMVKLPSRSATRAYSEKYDWGESVEQLSTLFHSLENKTI